MLLSNNDLILMSNHLSKATRLGSGQPNCIEQIDSTTLHGKPISLEQIEGHSDLLNEQLTFRSLENQAAFLDTDILNQKLATQPEEKVSQNKPLQGYSKPQSTINAPNQFRALPQLLKQVPRNEKQKKQSKLPTESFENYAPNPQNAPNPRKAINAKELSNFITSGFRVNTRPTQNEASTKTKLMKGNLDKSCNAIRTSHQIDGKIAQLEKPKSLSRYEKATTSLIKERLTTNPTKMNTQPSNPMIPPTQYVVLDFTKQILPPSPISLQRKIVPDSNRTLQSTQSKSYSQFPCKLSDRNIINIELTLEDMLKNYDGQ